MISIIIPFYNEENNLGQLLQEIVTVMHKGMTDYEAIFVDDGSTDESVSNLKYQIVKLQNQIQNRQVKIVNHRERLGKGKALATGVNCAKGEIIIFMDGDLQDNPADIRSFIKKIQEGYDFVNGVRKNRRENFIIKIYSKLGNYFLKNFSKSPFSDINCGFKTMRKQILENNIFYGNNFRFLPLAAYHEGFKVTEIVIDNRPRRSGKSKFGLNKPFIGLFDTLTAYFLYKFSEKPLHFFGAIGSLFFSLGFIIGLILSIERLFFGMLLYRRPALLLAILLIIVGIQIIMTGIIGELIVYLHKKSQQ